MIVKLSLIFFIFLGCSTYSEKSINEKDKPLKIENTVEVSTESESNTNDVKVKNLNPESQNVESFTPYAVKANKNKLISVFLGKLEDRMFYAIGVLKWIERNGFKIKKLQTTNAEEDQLFSHLTLNKKTSFIEWKLHQCCKDDFPLKNKTSYKEIMENFDSKVILPEYSQDQSGCLEFAEEHRDEHVMCIVAGDKSKVNSQKLESDMSLIIVNIGPVEYEQEFSLVDFVEYGYSLTQTIKK